MKQSTASISKRIPKLRFPEFQEVPEWEVKRLSKSLTIGNGRDYKHLSVGNIPVYGTGGYMLSVDDYLHDGESVCIGRKGTIDKPVFLTGKFWTVDTLFYTHSFVGCLPKYIYYLFLTIEWKNYNEAGGVPSLSKTTIGKIEISLPSIPEQQRIADCLSSLDEWIAAEANRLDALKNHKKGLMQQLFPAEGETTPKLRFAEFQDAPEWNERKISSFCKSFSGGTPTTSRKEFYGGSIPFIRSAEIGKETTQLFLTELGLAQSAAKLVKTGDVLVALYGANSGDVARARLDGAINQAILCLRPKTSEEFLSQYLQYKKEWIISTYIQGGQGNLSGEIIKSVELHFPENDEQERIANSLSSLDEWIIAQATRIEALQEFKQGLMQQLFPSRKEGNA